MVVEVKKDLLKSEADIIAHQTNCVGVMGAGVALQIKNKLLSEEEFEKYRILCEKKGAALLGYVQYLNAKNGCIIANLFGENIPTGTGVDTDYDSLKIAMEELEHYAATNLENATVAIPGYIGCGLAGGDWEQVFEIIYMTFKDSPVTLEICYLPDTDKTENTREKESTPLQTDASNLPNGYKWKHYEDGSGSIIGPNGQSYFSYDRQPYMNVGGVEYKKDTSSNWSIFWDGFGEFKRYAEGCIRREERKMTHQMIVDDYTNHDVEFSTSFLEFVTDISLLDAIEMYAELQYQINKDYVYLVENAVIEGEKITGGTICAFDKIFSMKDLLPGKNMAESLQIAEEKAKEAGMMLIRADWVDTDVYPEDGAVIIDGEIMDFLF